MISYSARIFSKAYHAIQRSVEVGEHVQSSHSSLRVSHNTEPLEATISCEGDKEFGKIMNGMAFQQMPEHHWVGELSTGKRENRGTKAMHQYSSSCRF